MKKVLIVILLMIACFTFNANTADAYSFLWDISEPPATTGMANSDANANNMVGADSVKSFWSDVTFLSDYGVIGDVVDLSLSYSGSFGVWGNGGEGETAIADYLLSVYSYDSGTIVMASDEVEMFAGESPLDDQREFSGTLDFSLTTGSSYRFDMVASAYAEILDDPYATPGEQGASANSELVLGDLYLPQEVAPNNAVPEPASMLLFGSGLFGLVGAGIKKRKIG